MDANRNELQFEKFLQSFEENPKSIEQNPTQNDLIIPPLIDIQDSSIKNQKPISIFPRNYQRSLLSPINHTSPATSLSSNQYYLISGVPMEKLNIANSLFNPCSMSIKNDMNRPTSNKRHALSPQARQNKRRASSPRPTEPPLSPLKIITVAGEQSLFGSDKGTELFSFKLKLAGRFRGAIQVLSDVDLNPEKFSMIEVDKNTGFKIIVQNDSIKAMVVLQLKTELLTEFRCAKRFQKLCSGILDSILMIFSSVSKTQYEDVLTVSYTEGSQFLYFKLDGDLTGKTFVKIVDAVKVYERSQTGNVSGFKIIVQNDSTKAMGLLHLKTDFLDEYQCAKKLSYYGVLDAILEYGDSSKVGYEDVLTVFSTEIETNINLSSQFGNKKKRPSSGQHTGAKLRKPPSGRRRGESQNRDRFLVMDATALGVPITVIGVQEDELQNWGSLGQALEVKRLVFEFLNGLPIGNYNPNHPLAAYVVTFYSNNEAIDLQGLDLNLQWVTNIFLPLTHISAIIP